MTANEKLILDPPSSSLSNKRETAQACRRLMGAHQSVQGLFDALHAARQRKVERGVNVRKLEHGEVDLLRAAIVFAGAGMDAVLKQLVLDCLPTLLRSHEPAQGEFQRWAKDLSKNEPRLAAQIIGAIAIEAARRNAYVKSITKGSLQSVTDLIRVRTALGLKPEADMSDQTFNGLSPFFEARNSIVHELDLKDPSGRGDSTRRSRRMKVARDQANAALGVTAKFIIATEEVLPSSAAPRVEN